MVTDRSFVTGFLVLGFAIFIAGFITGMLAIAVLPLSSDATAVGFTFFLLGFVTGMLAIALTLATIKLTRVEKGSA
jgi:sugar phosphate permease